MSADMWRLVIEGFTAGLTAAAGMVGPLMYWLIYKLSSVFVTRERFEQYKELVAKDGTVVSEAYTRLSDCIEKLSEEQKNLGLILARIEGTLKGMV